jgi:hypothetical protein
LVIHILNQPQSYILPIEIKLRCLDPIDGSNTK